MAEEVAKNLYRIEIPLPGNPLKALNSYLIKGNGRNLIVDTGMNMPECRAAMEQGLRELNVDPGMTDFFITHLHADHMGLLSSIVTDTSTVYFNRPEAERIKALGGWERMFDYARAVGFPEEGITAIFHNHPGRKFGGERMAELTLMQEGDAVRIGGYDLRCIETPGHTAGHLCLYDAQKKIFLAGDHLLKDVTPNIQLWSDAEDTLADYLASLDKVCLLDIDLVLPGHGKVFRDHRERIAELKEHHKVRMEEILLILKGGPRNAYQVASLMTWDIIAPSWEDFPISQRWFATGEALSHLKYLQERGRVRRETADGKARYCLA